MGLIGVSVPQNQQRQEPSALDNAAKVLGIGTALAGTAGQGYNAFVTAPAQAAAAAQQAKNGADTLSYLKGMQATPSMVQGMMPGISTQPGIK